MNIYKQYHNCVLNIISCKNNNKSISSGSCFLIKDPSERCSGYILTVYHNIEAGEQYYAHPSSGENIEVYEIYLIGYDKRLDIAILKIKDNTINKDKYIDIINSDSVNIGDCVGTIGQPKGFYDGAYSEGIINDTKGFDFSGPVESIKTNMIISNGNSGGPVLHKNGCIGIITWALHNGFGNDILSGGAVTSNLFKNVVNYIIINNTNHIGGYIGIEVEPVTAEYCIKNGLNYVRGFLIKNSKNIIFKKNIILTDIYIDDNTCIELGVLNNQINPIRYIHTNIGELLKFNYIEKVDNIWYESIISCRIQQRSLEDDHYFSKFI